MKKIIIVLILGIFLFSTKGADAFTVSSYGDLQICNSDNCNGQQKATSLNLYATVGWIGIGLSKNFDLNLSGYNMPSTFQLPVGQIAYSQNGDVYGAWNIIYSGLADSPPADGQLYPFSYGKEGDRWLNSRIAVSNPSGQGTPTLTSYNPGVVNCNQWGCWGVSPGSAYVTVTFSPVWVNIRGYIEEWKGYWKLRGDNTVGRSYQLPSIGYTIHVPPGPPNTLKATCAPDGNSVTLSWNNQAGYNRVYFRNYNATVGQNYAWNDDMWGSSTVVGGLTHGHTYSWWIHTKADSGAYSDAVVGTYTCSPAVDQCNNIEGTQASVPNGMERKLDGTCSLIVADQCTNVSGIQASVPASATKNADGTCSCSVGKHFEGAVCVDDVPLNTNLSVSCSAPAVNLGDETVFTSAVSNANGSVSYQWQDKNQNNIVGETGTIFRETYSTVNSHTVYIRATDSTTTATNYCNATVDCDNSHAEGETTACDINGNQNRYTCTSTGWKAISQTCGGGVIPGTDPTVTQFEFSPNIVSAGNKCGLTLVATNVSSCRLISSTNPTVNIPLTGINSTELLKSRIVPIGRYSLSCTNVEGTLTKEFGSKSCIINPDFKEN